MDTPDPIGTAQLKKASEINLAIEHDITQIPCTNGWTGYCATHDRAAEEVSATAEQARVAFICDSGIEIVPA